MLLLCPLPDGVVLLSSPLSLPLGLLFKLLPVPETPLLDLILPKKWVKKGDAPSRRRGRKRRAPRASEATSAESTSAEGTSAEATSAEGTRAQGTTAESNSLEGTSLEGRRVEGVSTDGTGGGGIVSEGSSAQGTTAAPRATGKEGGVSAETISPLASITEEGREGLRP